MSTVLILLVLTPVACFAIHGTVLRLPGVSRMPPQRTVMLSGFAACLVIALIAFFFAPSFTLYISLSSVLMAHVYFHIFNMSETARRIHLLVQLARGEAIRPHVYTAQEVTRVRVQRLIELATIREEKGRLMVNRGPLLWAACVLRAYEGILFPRRR